MDEQHQWLNLLTVPRCGAMTIAKWYQQNLMDEVFSQNPKTLQKLRLRPEQQQALLHPNQDFIRRVDQWCAHSGGQIIHRASPDYPELLACIDDPPPVLFCLGDRARLYDPQLAMVGSRHASPAGRALARQFAKEVTTAGYLVSSGLALGIDACAHEGALQVGTTLAVLGSGLAQVYPKRHQGLAQAIIDSGGLLLSEQPPWVKPQAFLFPRRNRILSGLAEGVLVVEASERSGSLITARLAAEQGREVFALPGAVGNPNAKGCHQLIKDGATLVDQVEDIFSTQCLKAASVPPNSSEQAYQQTLPNSVLLDNVRDSATSVDELVQQTGLAVDVVLSELLTLELEGRVAAVPGGFIRLRGS
ncbi:DNA-processing protein DprA [Neiella marina]|uniref:DNA-processing protein DprA n=1 Tax=Neiella holothuriorum TaxID=2870530 RepID=A0ABS7EKI0_9GAMM|nr:DNA-processing protein DprA [Neiella holothuriorum]MBW8192780.1 DNA-processing protein DprA [Neiella holothuriorum]